jgi:Zn-dependent protease
VFIDHLFSKDPEDPVYYGAVVCVSVLSIVLHELGHALAATWEGDPTPKIRGHLTWDPRVHMGWTSIILLLVAGLGWGSTPVSRQHFRHRRWGEAIVSFAGPAVNLLLVLVGAVALVFSAHAGAPHFIRLFWAVMTQWNIVLFLFNMIPVPPFDGFGVLDGAVDLGDLGARIRGASVLAGWLIAAMLVNFGVIPIFEWSEAISAELIRFLAGALGGA